MKKIPILAVATLGVLLLMGAGVNLSNGTHVFKPRPDQITANTHVVEVKNAAGTDKVTIDIEGDIVANSLTATTVSSSSCVVSGSALTAPALTIPDGGIEVTSGTLTVGGAAVLNGGLTMDSNKFTVADGTGATLIAGLASLNGGIAVDSTAFTVADSTGNTVVGGTFKYGSAASVSGATLIESKGLMSWTSSATDVSQIATKATVTQTFTATGVAPGDLALLITTASAVDAGVGNTMEAGLVFRCFVQIADTISCEFSNNTGATIDPPSRTYTFAIWDLT